MQVRKSINVLTAAERAAYVRGVKALQKSGRYQWYVATHANDAQNGNFHQTPWFLPWHRQFLAVYEGELRAALGDPAFTLPYWDSLGDWANALASSTTPLGDAQASLVATNASVWCDDFMGRLRGGPDGDDVRSGPFADLATTTPPGLLRRGYGRPGSAESTALPTLAALDKVLSEEAYDARNWDSDAAGFRNALEIGIHNPVHRWVGGSMLPMSSPNDPVFFLHHCNIDRLWALWQDAHPAATYLPPEGAGERWDADKPMWPWDGRSQPAAVTPQQTWDYRGRFAYGYAPPWSGPAFTGASTPMQPVLGDAATWQTSWASALIGSPGWNVFSGGENRPAFQPATQCIRCTGAFGLGLLGPNGALARTLYLCLRGSGARYQHPVTDPAGGSRRWFDGWNGTTWVAGDGGPVATPIGKTGDCWFRLTPGSSGTALNIQDGIRGDNTFDVWGFSG